MGWQGLGMMRGGASAFLAVAHQMVKRAECGFGTFANGNHNLLVRHRAAIARGKYAWHAGVAFGINHDFAAFAQFQRVLQPSGVGAQANLHKNARKRQLVRLACGAVLVAQGGYALRWFALA